MASDTKARALSRGNAAIPLTLLRVVGDFMSGLQADILTRAAQNARARTAKPDLARVAMDDLREAASAILAEAPGSFARQLRQKESTHARRHAS